MDLLASLEKEHSKKLTSRIVSYIGNDRIRFAELMKLFFGGEYRITQRAAWPMSYCVREHPHLIGPYFKKLVQLLKRRDVHPAVTRNIVRLLQDVEIPSKWQGEIMDCCFRFIADPEEAAAVKAFSFGVLENLLKEYPEILPEIKVIIDERWEHEGGAYRSRARRILKKYS